MNRNNEMLTGKSSDDVYDALECPITHEIIDDPLTLSSGIVYDRAALMSYVSSMHFGEARFPCPMSRKPIDPNELQNGTTLLIKRFIEDYIATNEQTDKGLIVEKRGIKPWFICPISREMMDEPVTVSSGATYDRKALTGYFLKYNSPENIPCLITGNWINQHELENGTAVVIKKFIKKIDLDPDEIKRIGATFVLPRNNQVVLAQFALAVGSAFTAKTSRVRKPMSIVFIMMVVMVAIAQLISKRDLIVYNLDVLQASFKLNTPSEPTYFSDFLERNDLFFRLIGEKEVAQYEMYLLFRLIEEKEFTQYEKLDLLMSKIGTNYRNGWGDTPLGIAVRRGDLKLVDMLLVHGANVNARDKNDERALFTAVDLGQLEMVDRLLNASPNLEALGRYQDTIVGRAAEDNNLELIDKLLTAGANINGQDLWSGHTPLMKAAYNGKVQATEKLLAAGANREIRDNAGRTALMYAERYPYIVHLLENFHFKSLHHASSTKDEATLQEKQQAIALGKGLFTLEDIEKMSKSALIQLIQPACLQALENGDTQIDLLTEMTASELEDANAVGQYPNANSPNLK